MTKNKKESGFRNSSLKFFPTNFSRTVLCRSQVLHQIASGRLSNHNSNVENNHHRLACGLLKQQEEERGLPVQSLPETTIFQNNHHHHQTLSSPFQISLLPTLLPSHHHFQTF